MPSWSHILRLSCRSWSWRITREPERWPWRERYFKRGVGPTEWLMVVVDFADEPARIVTAFGYGHGRTPDGWKP